jgi:Guanosine polyphosphate pyrophosphohydrolases/synthetases
MALEIQRAIIFATMKHREQKRKGTDIPYIVHPMECMQILSACGCPDNVIIAGILHDTLEDTDTTPQEILENFGKDVLEIVQNESEDKSKTWKEKKTGNLRPLERR